MANTSYLKNVVEPHIRTVLADRHGVAFTAQFLELRSGGRHEFDAVSSDGRVIASIKSASGLTSGRKKPSGKIKDCIAELYYLSLVDAPERVLVLTTPAFYDIFAKDMLGKVAEGITIECIPLPPDMQAEVDKVVKAASDEVSPEAAKRAIAAEIEAEAT
jgi:hypothetical protein